MTRIKGFFAPVLIVLFAFIGALGGLQGATAVGLYSLSSCTTPEGTAALEHSKQQTSFEIAALQHQLTNGQISQAEYDKQLNAVVAKHSALVLDKLTEGAAANIGDWSTAQGATSTGASIGAAVLLFAISEFRRKKGFDALSQNP